MPNITEKEYKSLQRKASKLDALEAGGVDNWEWYGESLSEWFKENEVEELVEDFEESLNDFLIGAEVDYPAGREAGHAIHFDSGEFSKMVHKLLEDYKGILED